MHDLCSNFADRYFRRHEGYNSRGLDRRYVHSQFSMEKVIRGEGDAFFTCCDFTPCATGVIVGLLSGDVKMYNNKSGDVYTTYRCYPSAVTFLKTSKDGTLLLTSSISIQPVSTMWNIEKNQFSKKSIFLHQEYVEFSKLNEDTVLGTSGSAATIYDVETGQSIATFIPLNGNSCTKNRATFSPCNELILSDGVLWDTRFGKELHRFNILNQAVSGVFHPNGWEIVSNTAVWDVRTLRLLKTVPELELSTVTFSPQNVIFGITHLSEGSKNLSTRFKTFRTLDSYDYSCIKTEYVGRHIFDLSINKYGTQIALVENLGVDDWYYESTNVSSLTIDFFSDAPNQTVMLMCNMTIMTPRNDDDDDDDI
ncbi:Protein mahjong [Pseudolycoriella hygida]|uniref:Protein mahjong n=1 Tax=Pseudolycoriella hygida TaxID=35572 RepID=A0A9Q0N976_9DIPT|nr:Protein mahjong [Pseudolycoriella hygida]